MSSIDKTGNGRWRARYRDPAGKSRSRTFRRKGDAERFLAATATDIHRGDWVDPKLRRARFDEWADAFEDGLVRLAPTTARRYRQLLTLQIRPWFGGRPIASVDYQDVESFIVDLYRRGYSAKTVRDCVSVLSQVMKAAARARVIRENPATGHNVKVTRQRGQVLPLTELHRLVGHTREDYRLAVIVLIYTGMRPSELCGLRVHHLDMFKGTVHICETLTPVGSRLVAGTTKTDQERVVPLPHFVCELLAAHLAGRAEQLSRSVAGDDYVFTGVKGTPLNRDFLRKGVLVPALRAAGLPEDFRTYDLRHAHASQLIDMGASPLAIKERLGHADVLTTFRKYGHLFQGVQERLTAQLEEPTVKPWRRNHRARSSTSAGRYAEAVRELSAQERLVLSNAAASARLEGQALPEEDEELAAAYLAGEIDAATYQQRIRDLITGSTTGRPRTA